MPAASLLKKVSSDNAGTTDSLENGLSPEYLVLKYKPVKPSEDLSKDYINLIVEQVY